MNFNLTRLPTSSSCLETETRVVSHTRRAEKKNFAVHTRHAIIIKNRSDDLEKEVQAVCVCVSVSEQTWRKKGTKEIQPGWTQ
jgi:hypothetical protein